MFLSIIIPVHNVEDYLRDCIESVLCQSSNDYEVLLIENASTDNSLDICKQYQNNPKISLYTLETGGVSKARNFGMKKAVGKYIWFVDSDDIVSKNSVEYLKEKSEFFSNPDVLIFAHDEIVDGKSVNQRVFTNEGVLDKITAVNGLFSANLWSGFVWNKIIKNSPEILKSCAFPEDVHMIEDLVFTTECFFNCNSFAVVNKCLYSYRKREGSISNTCSEKKLSAFNAYELILSELNELKEYDFARRVIGNAKVDFSRQILSYYCNNDFAKYKIVKSHYKKIILKNFKHITRFKAKIAALIVLISPKLLNR